MRLVRTALPIMELVVLMQVLKVVLEMMSNITQPIGLFRELMPQTLMESLSLI